MQSAAAHTPQVLLLFMGLLGPWQMPSDGNFGLSAVSDSPSHPGRAVSDGEMLTGHCKCLEYNRSIRALETEQGIKSCPKKH